MIVGVAALVAGCANTIWSRPGGSTPEAERDVAECQYEASKATVSIRSIIEQILTAQDLTRQCLRLRGYSPQA